MRAAVMCQQDGLQRHVCVKVMSSGGGTPAEALPHTTPLAVTDLVRPKSPNIYSHRSWRSRLCRPPALTRNRLHVDTLYAIKRI